MFPLVNDEINNTVTEMVTPVIRKNLEKQGDFDFNEIHVAHPFNLHLMPVVLKNEALLGDFFHSGYYCYVTIK